MQLELNLSKCVRCPHGPKNKGSLCALNGQPYAENARTGYCPEGRFKPHDKQIFTLSDGDRTFRLLQIKQICDLCSEKQNYNGPRDGVICRACKKCGPKIVSLIHEICPLGKFTSVQLEQKIAKVFDRVVLINLKRRPDRLERFWKHFETVRWPFVRPEVFEAIDGSKVPVPDGWFSGGGAWGCMQSHRHILEQAIMQGVESVLILEDDAFFQPNFVGAVSQFLESVPQDWEGLMIGGQHFAPTIAVNPTTVRCANTQRTHCYAVRGKLLRALYSKWCASYGHCDHIMGPFFLNYKVYAPTRFLCAQDANKSDISNKNLPRKFWNPGADAPVVHLTCDRRVLAQLQARGYLCRPVPPRPNNLSPKAHGIALREWLQKLKADASMVENGVATIYGEVEPIVLREMTQEKYITKHITNMQEGLEFLIQLHSQIQTKWYGHAGDIGDIIYGLAAIKADGGGVLYTFPQPGKVREPMTKERYELLRPLMLYQPYVHDFVWSPTIKEHPINGFRSWHRSGNLTEMHFACLGLPYQDAGAWLTAPARGSAKVLFHRSPRYQNPAFPWQMLADRYRQDALFIGLEEEHKAFESAFGPVEYYRPQDFLDVASLIAGCDLFIGNQSSPAAIAEGLKHKMILEVSPQIPNCIFKREGRWNGWDESLFKEALP